MKMVTQYLAAGEEEEGKEGFPYLMLALAVVEQAITDIWLAGRKQYPKERDCDHMNRVRNGEEARNFLLVRLWEDGNLWGDVLRCHGVAKFDQRRLVHAVRGRGEKNRKERE